MSTEDAGGDRPDDGPGRAADIDPGQPSETMGYERARDELVEVVRALEAGGLSLDDSVGLWERGERLARLCEQRLAGARDRVEAVLADGATPEKGG